MTMARLPFHHEETVLVPAHPAAVFAFADDHRNLAGHMNEKSVMMAGISLTTEMDEEHGRALGSHLRMSGRVLGVHVDLDEVVTERDVPYHKGWSTVGEPHLLVVGPYRMGFDVAPATDGAAVRVTIDYAMPKRNTWLGKLFGAAYARWCVRQMTQDIQRHFA